MAASAQERPSFKVPSANEVLGYSCSASPKATIGVGTQDPQTLDYKGRVWVNCPGSPQNSQWSYGCAMGQWDSTGTSYTLTILWRDQFSEDEGFAKQREEGKRCGRDTGPLTMKILELILSALDRAVHTK
jgi:hypothetical protein